MLTVYILAKNEEDTILECLNSVKSVANEIIVVNNGSVDKTKEICLAFGCIVFDSPTAQIDESRNLFLHKAKNPWILSIDADERLDARSCGLLFDEIRKADECVYAFTLNSYQYVGRGNWATVRMIRVFRNHSGIKYNDSKIHSSIMDSVVALNGKVAHTAVFYHHLDILYKNRAKNKRARYRNELINTLENKNLSSPLLRGFLMSFLGLEYAAIQEYDLAESLYNDLLQHYPETEDFANLFLAQNYLLQNKFDKSIEVSNRLLDTELRPQSLLILAEVNNRSHVMEDALYYVQLSLKENPDYAHNYLNLAILSFEKTPAISIEAILKATEINPYVANPVIYGEGELPNIFFQQASLLSCNKTIYEIMNECCSIMGTPYVFDKWINSCRL